MDGWIDGYDNGSLLFFLAATLIPSVIAVARLVGFPSQAYIERWFTHHRLEMIPESVEYVTRSLQTMKYIRTAGFVLGYTGLQLGWMLIVRDARRFDELPFIPLLLAVWGIAVVVAALCGVRTGGLKVQDSRAPGASLAERRVDDYRPAFTPYDREVLAAALIVLTIGWWLFPGEEGGTVVDGASALRYTAPALLAMAAVRWAQHLVVAQRQALPTIDLVRADDALRTSGVAALTGLGYGIPLAGISVLFWGLLVVHDPPGFVLTVAIVFTLVLSTAAFAMVTGLGRLGNDVVIYRHRLRPPGEFTGTAP